MTDAAGRDGWHIVEDDLSGAPIRALLERHFAGMLANSPEESCHFLDFEGLKALVLPSGLFIAAPIWRVAAR